MKEWAEAFYKSKAWQRTRRAYIASVFGLCERCKAKGKLVPGKIVHHKVHLNEHNINDPTISLNQRNLEYLCQKCHNDEHMRIHGKLRAGLAIDYSTGNLIQVSDEANGCEV